jgi:hypothetical protein
MLEAAPDHHARRLRRHRQQRQAHSLFGRLGTAAVEPSNATIDVGTFWHVTDWHVNEFQPADPNPCDMCRSRASASCTQPPAGAFGHQECDPPPAFWGEALALMRREAPDPDFILAGGDWIGHVPPAQDGPAAVRSAALLLATMLHEHFPTAPVMHERERGSEPPSDGRG